MSNPCRVLFAIGSLEGGGAERQLVEILKHLDRSRFSPSLYLVNRRGELFDELADDVEVTAFSDLQWSTRFNYPGRFRRAVVAHITDTLRTQSPDVVYDRCYPVTTLMAPATRQAGVPRVSTAVADPAAEIGTHPRMLQPYYFKRAHQAYRTADRVIANSGGLRQRMIDYYGLPDELVTTVYNILDIDRIDQLAALSGPDWKSDRFHIICSGRLHPDKGYLYLLEAIDDVVNRREFKHLQLHIYGQGPQEQELKELASARKLNDAICFEGFNVNPFPAFRLAQLFCLSSLNEGMPNAVPEAMACRVPVLSTDCHSGPREILDGGRYGRLVPTADARALADAIEDAIKQYDKWQEPLEPARRHVVETFSVSAGMSRLEEVLVDVMASKL